VVLARASGPPALDARASSRWCSGRGDQVRAGGAAAVALAAGYELAAARAVVLGADLDELAAAAAMALGADQ